MILPFFTFSVQRQTVRPGTPPDFVLRVSSGVVIFFFWAKTIILRSLNSCG